VSAGGAKRSAKGVQGKISALVLQGGGALGAYELGVIERLYEEPGFDLRYVSGVSIGAITAAILVGPRNGDPLGTLRQLWDEFTVVSSPFLPDSVEATLATFGNSAFYRPRSDYLAMPTWTSFYDVGPIRRRLAELVDFDAIRRSKVRLVVTATDVKSGTIDSFDNKDNNKPLTIDHILASGSLPPGFPMTRIGEKTYWDGGLFNNTPLSPLMGLINADGEADRTHVFVVNLFPNAGHIPQNMIAVADRIVELIFANKTKDDVKMAGTINRFVKLVEEMKEGRDREFGKLLEQDEYKDLTRFKAFANIVEITNTRDEPVNAASDFSEATIKARIAAGYQDADARLAEAKAASR